MDSWFRMLSPAVHFRLPASGDVSMDYSPWTNWGISRPKAKAGNPEIEAEVFREVALPGKQLGKLTEATLAMAELVKTMQPDILEQHPEQANAIQAVVDLAADIERTKDEHRKAAKEEAIKALERLRQTDPDQYRSFVDDLHSTDKT
jgi:hypothetical protein